MEPGEWRGVRPIASMNGVAMAAVAGVRRAVARPSARTGLIVTAVVWVITRVPMYLIDTGQGARPPGGAVCRRRHDV